MKAYKHRLLGTSALAAAVAVASGAAMADEMKPHLKLGGFYNMDAHFTDEDGIDTDPGMFMVHDMEVIFDGGTEFDNGLKVGGHVEFEGAGGARVDDHWITFESGWGKILMGATDPVGGKTMVTAPSGPYGVTSGLQTDWFKAVTDTKCTFRCALYGARLDAGTDETGIHYFSPRFNGFQFAVGFRPEATGSGSVNQGRVDESTDVHNAVDMAVNYSGMLGGVGISASVGVGSAEAPTMMANPADKNMDKGADHDHTPGEKVAYPYGDYEHVHGGLRLGAMGFTVGGHIASEGTDKHPQNGNSFGLGVTYGQGPWMVGVDMFSGSIEGTAAAGEHEYDAWAVGGSYAIGPGVKVNAGFQSGSLELESGTSTDGSAFTVGVAVGF